MNIDSKLFDKIEGDAIENYRSITKQAEKILNDHYNKEGKK